MELTSKEKLIELLRNKFKDCWFKDGAEFSDNHPTAIWSGEGSVIDNMNLVNDYSESKRYIMGVHEKMDAFLKRHGWYHELYDTGTVMFYPNM